jgi:hypothetical protein
MTGCGEFFWRDIGVLAVKDVPVYLLCIIGGGGGKHCARCSI